MEQDSQYRRTATLSDLYPIEMQLEKLTGEMEELKSKVETLEKQLDRNVFHPATAL